MQAVLRNKSRSVRVVYDARSRIRTIGIGEMIEVDLPDSTIASIKKAQALGDKLEIALREAPIPTLPTQQTAAEVLERASEMSYFELLAAIKRIAPNSGLPQRPTKAQMLGLLNTLSPNST